MGRNYVGRNVVNGLLGHTGFTVRRELKNGGKLTGCLRCYLYTVYASSSQQSQ